MSIKKNWRYFTCLRFCRLSRGAYRICAGRTDDAQDIGTLPVNTVGEALQRVRGVQVTRNNDQVVGVNIRGLPYVETTLNGDEIFTTNQRTFDFQNMPAEALSGVDVYETGSADKVEGGIAGPIDVRTHRPFDFAFYGGLSGS